MLLFILFVIVIVAFMAIALKFQIEPSGEGFLEEFQPIFCFGVPFQDNVAGYGAG
jgi:hypothetical protein